MLNLSDQYAAAFKFLEQTATKDFELHVATLKTYEKILPFGMTFMFVTNASTQQYLYFTDNVEHCTGLKKEDLYKGGVPFVLSRVHPDDRKLWTESVGMLYNELLKLPKEKRLKTNMQFNYRFLHQNNSYINIVDNFIPIELNKKGEPYVYFGQVNITGNGEELPVNASLSVLNTAGNYETLYNVNVSKEVIAKNFTKRENEILHLMVNGYTSQAIAEELAITLETTKTHRRNISNKLKSLDINKKHIDINY